MTRTTPPPRYDIAALFPELVPLAKQTVRLHPRPGPELPANASKLGGNILWPADEPWPVCTEPEWNPWDENAPPHDHIYVPILQLRRNDFPDFPFPDGTDLFQFLWCPSYHEINLGPDCKAYWRTEAAITNPLTTIPAPTLFEEDRIPRPCGLHPERVTEYPYQSDLPESLSDAIGEWEGRVNYGGQYFYELSVAYGSMLSGYVHWIQGT